MTSEFEDDLLYWSLFERKDLESGEFNQLALLSSIGQPNVEEHLHSIREEVFNGSKVAVAFRHRTTKELLGLCIFGVHNPPPSDQETLALDLFSSKEPNTGSPSTKDRLRRAAEDELLSKVMDFARIHGFDRVRTYLRTDSPAVSVFLRNAFIVEHCDKTRGLATYCLGREVLPYYDKDPYDFRTLIQWLCSFFSLKVCKQLDNGVEAKFNLNAPADIGSGAPHTSRIEFDVKVVVVRATNISALSSAPDMPTVALLDEDIELTKLTLGPNISVIGLSQLKQLTANIRIDPMFWPPESGYPHIEVEIRKALFKKFQQNSKNAFIDSGQYGSVMSQALAIKHPTLRIFFVDYQTARDRPTLLGVGTVREIVIAQPTEIWRRFGTISSFDEDGFRRYASIKRNMTAIIFDELRTKEIPGVTLPIIQHSWRYVSSQEGYQVYRETEK